MHRRLRKTSVVQARTKIIHQDSSSPLLSGGDEATSYSGPELVNYSRPFSLYAGTARLQRGAAELSFKRQIRAPATQLHHTPTNIHTQVFPFYSASAALASVNISVK